MPLTPEEQAELDSLNGQAPRSSGLSPEEEKELAQLNASSGSHAPPSPAELARKAQTEEPGLVRGGMQPNAGLLNLIGAAPETPKDAVNTAVQVGQMLPGAGALPQAAMGAYRGFNQQPNADLSSRLGTAAVEGGAAGLTSLIPGGAPTTSLARRMIGAGAAGTVMDTMRQAGNQYAQGKDIDINTGSALMAGGLSASIPMVLQGVDSASSALRNYGKNTGEAVGLSKMKQMDANAAASNRMSQAGEGLQGKIDVADEELKSLLKGRKTQADLDNIASVDTTKYKQNPIMVNKTVSGSLGEPVTQSVPSGKYDTDLGQMRSLATELGDASRFVNKGVYDPSAQAKAKTAGEEWGRIRGQIANEAPESSSLYDTMSGNIERKKALNALAETKNPISAVAAPSNRAALQEADSVLGGNALEQFGKNASKAESLRDTGEMSLANLKRLGLRTGLGAAADVSSLAGAMGQGSVATVRAIPKAVAPEVVHEMIKANLDKEKESKKAKNGK